jgi:hypothetical protein
MTGRSSDEGNRGGLADAPFAGTAVVVRINNLWWPCRPRYDCHGEKYHLQFDDL